MTWNEDKVREALEALARAAGRPEAEVEAYVELELPRQRRQRAEGYPQGRATRFTTADDPSVFGSFDFVDLLGNREWRVTGWLATDADGALVVRRVVVAPWIALPGRKPPPGYDVTTTVLRGIHIALIRDRAARQLREWSVDLAVADQVGWPTPSADEREMIELGAEKATGPVSGPGRRGFGDDFYRRLALRYLALQDERDRTNRGRRGLVRELAAEFDLTPTQARDAVATARELGWLEPGSPGRAGAEPGPRLREETR